MATNNHKKWTVEEDECLIRYVKARPQNLKACFLAVSEATGRTERAVAYHWYTRTSKDPRYLCFFTASSRHIAKNRKNVEGEASNYNIWRKFLRILRSL